MGVMQAMSELAPIYNLNKTSAMIAGILHDIAKEFTPEDLIERARAYHIVLHTEYDKHPLFLHGPIGACYAAQQLGITDPAILDAISRHSYLGRGVALSPPFCWCLRFADMLEPSRDWDDLKSQLKPFVYAGNVEKGAYTLVKWLISFHEAASLPVHPNIRGLVQELSNLSLNMEGLAAIHKLPV